MTNTSTRCLLIVAAVLLACAKALRAEATPAASPRPYSVRSHQYRLVDAGKKNDKPPLYDITVDPGETNDLATALPTKVAELKGAYDHKWAELVKELAPMPTPVGYAEWLTAILPPPDGVVTGKRHFQQRGNANDFLSD